MRLEGMESENENSSSEFPIEDWVRK